MDAPPQRLQIDAVLRGPQRVLLGAHLPEIVWMLQQENQGVRPRTAISIAGLDEGLQEIVVGPRWSRMRAAFGEQRLQQGMELPFGPVTPTKFGQRQLRGEDGIKPGEEIAKEVPERLVDALTELRPKKSMDRDVWS
jgi:hypothetical protein